MNARPRRFRTTRLHGVLLAAVVIGLVASLSASGEGSSLSHAMLIDKTTAAAPTMTPIKHVIVIFDENVSFDHYFGTYPNATNTSGQPFFPAPGTPSVNGLTTALLTANPNGSNPQRLDPSKLTNVLTCDQNHSYTPEETAFDGGKMDMFTAATGTATTTGTSPTGVACAASDVMNYYDGNTVTAEWNYAQHYAMSDNNFGSTFGPSTEGAINVTSGNTGGAIAADSVRGSLTDGDLVADGEGAYSVIGDAQPYWDDCSTGVTTALSGENIGDLLNAEGLSWGWFQGGFAPVSPYTGSVDTVSSYNQLNPDNTPVKCTQASDIGAAIGGTGQYGATANYSAHYDGFQFTASTANPHHLAPTSLAVVGTDTATPGEFDTANHNYDLTEFFSLVKAIDGGTLPASSLPAVIYLKPSVFQTGHPATSDPLDEQTWLVNAVNAIETLPTWKSTAIFVTYDDSDGWYDHVSNGVSNPSLSSADTLDGAGICTKSGSATETPPLGGEQGRCGFGPRLPLITISPCAKANSVDNDLSDQASILNFIEYNWQLPSIPGSFDTILEAHDKAKGLPFDLADMFDFAHCNNPTLMLDPATGEVDMQGANEAGHNLHGWNLSSAEATGANFQGANLSDAFLEHTDFAGSSLEGANLQGANLTKEANLTNANLAGANLKGAHMSGALLSGAKWSDTTCPDGTNSNSDGGSCTGHL
jgi:phospholipase C